MDTDEFKEIISFIRAEESRRDQRRSEQPLGFTNDHWLFVDMPFVNELCLMLLVRLSHQVERELVLLVERIPRGTTKEIGLAEYRSNVEKRRKHLKEMKGRGWVELYEELGVKSGEPAPLKVLRLLANSYKHDPFELPDPQLLVLLKLPAKRELLKRKLPSRADPELKVFYASLSESCLLQKGLVDFFHLGESADYCDIAEQFIDFSSRFLTGLKSAAMVPFKQELVPMNDVER